MPVLLSYPGFSQSEWFSMVNIMSSTIEKLTKLYYWFSFSLYLDVSKSILITLYSIWLLSTMNFPYCNALFV